jgi:hypothetical protein
VLQPTTAVEGALFGFSIDAVILSVTKGLNGDNKSDIVIGSPAYLGKQPLSVQSGVIKETTMII